MKLIPFDLEKALAGEPVVTRNGFEVTKLTTFEISRGVILVGVMGGDVQTWTKNGKWLESGMTSDFDLFMKPKTRVINGFEVPAPESEPLKANDDYYFPDFISSESYGISTWCGDDFDKRLLKTRLVFLTKEDAIANAKAMLGIDPHGNEE